jgi:hypothetical protein
MTMSQRIGMKDLNALNNALHCNKELGNRLAYTTAAE